MEKYGTIPPKFTKEWWEYFWDYYKVHTICTVAAIVIIVSTIVQCANSPEYEVEFRLFGQNKFSWTSDNFYLDREQGTHKDSYGIS